MSRVRRALIGLALFLGPASTGTALADHLEPEKRIRPGDQVRARAMLVRSGDVPGATAQRRKDDPAHVSCASLDESDLTVTADVESATWTWGPTVVSSSATLYESVRDAESSWRRGTSAAGLRCLRAELGREFRKQGARLGSLSRIPFPRMAPRTAAYRLTLASETQGQQIRVVLDFVVLMHGRAQTGLVVASVLEPAVRAAELRLARTIAARMAKAMRGA